MDTGQTRGLERCSLVIVGKVSIEESLRDILHDILHQGELITFPLLESQYQSFPITDTN